jgi:hypothetical protein
VDLPRAGIDRPLTLTTEVLDVLCQTQIPAEKQTLLDTLAPVRPDVVVAVECLFAWYWVADLCAAHNIPCYVNLAPRRADPT